MTLLLGLLAALATALFAGIGLLLLLRRGAGEVNAVEHLALGWLCGTGAISLLLWIGGLMVSGAALQTLVTLTAVALGVSGMRRARRRGLRFIFPKPRSFLEFALTSALVLELGAMFYLAGGHGLGWDGLLNWEIKARYAFFNGGVIPQEYYRSASRAFTHPAYPLYIPLTELWLYLWMGQAHQFWLKILFPIYYAAGALVLVVATTRLTGLRSLGLLAACLLFFVPALISSPGGAAVGYVDVPLSMLYLAAVGYLLLFVKAGDPDAWRLYALNLALLPWAKREGAILWGMAALLGVIALWRRKGNRRLLLWLLPGLCLIVAWKFFLVRMGTAGAQEFVPITLANLRGNLGRVVPIIRLVVEEMRETARWSCVWLLAAAAFASLCWRARNLAVLLLGAAVAGPIVIYSATYLFSAWPDFSIHFQESFSRLLLHVLPLVWLAIALAARPTQSPNESNKPATC